MEKYKKLTVELPIDQHLHLKMMATRKGISMRDYILEALAFKESAEEIEEIDKTSFKKGLERIRKDRYQLARNLSKR